MENLRIKERVLSDGSRVYAVTLIATHGDCTNTLVTIEANDKSAASRLYDALINDCAYVETQALRI